MGISVARKAVFILVTLSLLSGCGELETLFPSNESYQVKVLVNGAPLEDCSVIRSSDKIRPYFTIPVEDDPDLIGLLVYFQNPQGKIIGEKIKYIIRPDAAETEQTETKPTETNATETNTTEAKTVETKTQEETEPDNTDDSDFEETKFFETETVLREKWSFANTKPKPEENTEVEIGVISLAQELPYFSLPTNVEMGSYTLVFEALGKRETLSSTELSVFYLGNAEFNLKDIVMYLPGLSGSQIVSPGTTVLLETRLEFDSRLDPYVIWYNGKNIISEGKVSDGAGNILWTAPGQAGFYSLRLEAFPFQLKRNFAGISREIALPISPKAVGLGYFFENNQNYTARSVLAAGTVYPEQIRLAAAAVIPESGKEETSPPELLQWYQFEGSLYNSMPASANEQSLKPLDDKVPHWTGVGQSYGLSTGSDDIYKLPSVNFFREGQDKGGGIFLSHIRPPDEGTVLSVFFPLESSLDDGAWMEMVCEENVIALRIKAGGATVEIPVYPDFSESQGFVPVVTEFYIRPYRLEAKISLGEGLKSNAGAIGFPNALLGEGRIILGGQEKSKPKNNGEVQIITVVAPKEDNKKEDDDEDISTVVETLLSPAKNRETNTIWDEFAVLLSAVPLFPEDFFVAAVIEQEDPVPSKQSKEGFIPVDYTPVNTGFSTEEIPVVPSQEESILLENDGEKTGGDESFLSPVVDIDVDDPVQETETIAVLSENT